MKRFIVISDTHISSYMRLPEALRRDIESASGVIHAGDIGTEEFYLELKSKTPHLYAVRGNNDMFPLPRELVFKLDKVKIALIHGDQAGGDRQGWLIYYFDGESPDIIIFGHSHKPYMESEEGVSFLNPGSPTRNRGLAYNTYAYLDIEDGRFDVSFSKIEL